MRLLTHNELLNLSFPDCHVLEMHIDNTNRNAQISTDTGYISLDGGIEIKNCKIFISKWSLIKAFLYRTKTQEWEKISPINEPLEDICEFEIGNEIILRGFGAKSGQWIELIFSEASIVVKSD